MDARRYGMVTQTLGIPETFAAWLERGEALKIRIDPGAKVTETCDLFVNLEADDLRSFVGAGGTSDLETVQIQLSRVGSQALVYKAAAEMVATMPPDELAKRKLNPGIAQLWLQESERLVYREITRRHNLEDVGRTQRWVA
jgi:hypothetical protein